MGVFKRMTVVQTEATVSSSAVARLALREISARPARSFMERTTGRIDPDSIVPGWMNGPSGHPVIRQTAVLSRCGDVLTSLLLLMLTGPLMVFVALLIKLDSRGPSLYRQDRVGLGGKIFTVLKFRSMRVDAEAAGPAWASLRDPRVTRVGGFLRRTRIDELPQLFNVLRGDMALIGPRPERPHFQARLSDEIPNFRERLLVKPGLTGWAQVNFRYGASVEDAHTKLSYDLYYVKHRSAWLDLKILLATVRVVLFQEGSR